MVQGLLEFLTGPSLAAKQLRDHFVFKIVPVLNPDGVVVGNQRVNLSGADLNRRWDAQPSRALPTPAPTLTLTPTLTLALTPTLTPTLTLTLTLTLILALARTRTSNP